MKQTNIDRKCKIDPMVTHCIPAIASRKRKQNEIVRITRQWGKYNMLIKSEGVLNIKDLITLLQLLGSYQNKKDKWEKAGNMDGRPIVKCKVDTKRMVAERGLTNNKHNRETIIKSIYRWFRERK